MDRNKSKLSERIEIRVTYYEKNFIRGLADIYADGNMSAFLVWAAFNCDKKFLTGDEMLDSDRNIRKGRRKAPPE